jgi:hypothetical protein
MAVTAVNLHGHFGRVVDTEVLMSQVGGAAAGATVGPAAA